MATKRKVTTTQALGAVRFRSVGALLRAAGACRPGAAPFNAYPNTRNGRRDALANADFYNLVYMLRSLAFDTTLMDEHSVLKHWRVLQGSEAHDIRAWCLEHDVLIHRALLGRAVVLAGGR